MLVEPLVDGRAATASGPAATVSDDDQPPLPLVVDLDDERALEAGLVGTKAATLARARLAGLPVLPGFVLTTIATQPGSGLLSPSVKEALVERLGKLSFQERRPVIVRSSSRLEDGTVSSMAGLFASVPDVRSWGDFMEALAMVLASGEEVAADAPMAVLVQAQVTARAGGVLFGAEPVTGRSDRLVVAATEDNPERLVSGAADGAYYVLTPSGRCLAAERPLAALGEPELRGLAELAESVASLFGGPQDVEWAFDEEGKLQLLQSRPITSLPPRRGASERGPSEAPFNEEPGTVERTWAARIGTALAQALLRAEPAAGRPASGGRSIGRVHAPDGEPEPGAVLVVPTLSSELAPLLPRIGGIVAETGSVLSHLAVLAREFGVPTVVGIRDALHRFPPGTEVIVDGNRGKVAVVSPSAPAGPIDDAVATLIDFGMSPA
jgi:phosphoenolpyruvate synthase/pyruvate phosphate dikinase